VRRVEPPQNPPKTNPVLFTRASGAGFRLLFDPLVQLPIGAEPGADVFSPRRASAQESWAGCPAGRGSNGCVRPRSLDRQPTFRGVFTAYPVPGGERHWRRKRDGSCSSALHGSARGPDRRGWGPPFPRYPSGSTAPADGGRVDHSEQKFLPYIVNQAPLVEFDVEPLSNIQSRGFRSGRSARYDKDDPWSAQEKDL
jgi:hypothetical protein